MKLSATTAENSFKYSWLLSRIWPYIKPYMFRIILGFLVAIPLGLLDGVTAFALKPYMDYVIGGKSLDFTLFSHDFSISSIQMSFIFELILSYVSLIKSLYISSTSFISLFFSILLLILL